MKKIINILLVACTIGIMVPVAGNVGFEEAIMATALAILFMFLPKPRRRGHYHYQGVTIALTNGGLGGTVQTEDGVVGLVMTGVTESGGYTLGTPILVTGMTSVTAAGISQANNPFAWRHLTEFYNEAGDGAQLYLMLTSNATTVAMMALNTNANGVVKMLNYAAGAIKVVGLLADDKAIHTAGGTITQTNGLNADCYTAASNLQTTINGYVAAEQPLRGIIGCTSYTGVAANLTNMTTGSNNRVGFFLGDTQIYDATYTSSAIGLLLGRIATIPVQRKISRVLDGPRSNNAAYLGSTPILCTTADVATIGGKGFMTFIAYANRSGFFFSGDPMLTATTDDYQLLCRGRVIDKAHVIAYQTYLNQVDNDVPVKTDGSGQLDPNYSQWMQNLVLQQLVTTMQKAGEITNADCYIDPTQNVVSTNMVIIVLKIRPKAYSSTIVVNLGFEQ